MPFIASIEGRSAFGRPPPAAPAAPTSNGGSILLTASSTSGISIPNSADVQMGTGDFTIEWFQYQLASSGSFQRIFSIGSYPAQSIAVSQEGSDTSKAIYMWASGGVQQGVTRNLQGAWYHFAVTRASGSLRVFLGGTQIGTTAANSTNFNNAAQVLRIGNESTTSSGAAFNGYITNFHWVKGTALYTANFTPPTRPITPVANTKLLLLATTSGTVLSDSSGTGKVATGTGVAWNSLTPFL
jgi:hypothetical protein